MDNLDKYEINEELPVRKKIYELGLDDIWIKALVLTINGARTAEIAAKIGYTYNYVNQQMNIYEVKGYVKRRKDGLRRVVWVLNREVVDV